MNVYMNVLGISRTVQQCIIKETACQLRMSTSYSKVNTTYHRAAILNKKYINFFYKPTPFYKNITIYNCLMCNIKWRQGWWGGQTLLCFSAYTIDLLLLLCYNTAIFS